MEDFHQLSERLTGLETKLRNTFVQIDQRLGELETIKTENSEERLQEIEDLMLLLQVDNTKIRESIGRKEDSSFMGASSMPDDAKIYEKLETLEQEVRALSGGAPVAGSELESRISYLEKKLDAFSEKNVSADDAEEMGSELKSIRRSGGDDVEKRLSALEDKIEEAGGTSSVVPEDLGRKIRQLEDKIESLGNGQSVKELEETISGVQSYVKEKLESVNPSGIMDLVTKKGLQEYADKLAAARSGIEKDMEKMASMKNDLDSIAGIKKDLEEKLSRQAADSQRNSALLEKIQAAEKNIDEKLGEIDALSREMDKKVAEAGERLLAKATGFPDTTSTDDRFGKVEKTLEQLWSFKSVMEASKLKEHHVDSVLEKNLVAIKELGEHIEEESVSRVSMEKSLQDVKSRLEKLAGMDRELQKERHAIKEITESTGKHHDDIDRKLESLGKKLSLVSELRKDLDEESVSRVSMEKSLQDIRNDMSNVEKLEKALEKERKAVQEMAQSSASYESSVQAKLGEMTERMAELDATKQDLLKEKNEIRKMAESGSNYTANVEKRVKELESHLQQIARLKMELENESVKRLADERIINDIRRQFSLIENRMEKFAAVPSDMHAMVAAIDHLRQGAATETEARASLEQGIAGMREKLQGMESAWKDIEAKNTRPQIGTGFLDKIGQMQSRLDGIEKRIGATSPAAGGYAKVEEELNTHITDFSNQMNALRGRLMQESSEFSQFMKQNDINQFRKEMKEHHKMLRSIDKRIEKSAIRFFAENLEDFAKAMDRRTPIMVTREAYDHDMHALAAKLSKIEAPDGAALYERMDSLERDIGRTIVAMRSMMSRVPVVVE
ncbi:MAG TPA: hypothetical protein VI979_01955 [archaeon]|nr:hypothetical protein [archaeon]